MPECTGGRAGIQTPVSLTPKSERSPFPGCSFLAHLAEIPPLTQPSSPSWALMPSSPCPLLTSTWKCSCSQVTFPTLSRSRRGDSLWPEPSNAARAPDVHSSRDAVYRMSEWGRQEGGWGGSQGQGRRGADGRPGCTEVTHRIGDPSGQECGRSLGSKGLQTGRLPPGLAACSPSEPH